MAGRDWIDETLNQQAQDRVSLKIDILDKVITDLKSSVIDSITERENRASIGRMKPDERYLKYAPILCMDRQELACFLLTRLVIDSLPLDPE